MRNLDFKVVWRILALPGKHLWIPIQPDGLNRTSKIKKETFYYAA